jgi:mycothiol synthase
VISIRRVETDADVETWVDVRNAVLPNEPATVEQTRRADGEPGRLLVLAELDGAVAGAGIAARSSFGGRAFLAPRVLPELRGRGVGRALVRALSDHARSCGFEGVNAFVAGDDARSVAFARSCGLADVDLQLEQVRRVAADEPAPEAPDGIELVALGARRDELLRVVWPVAAAGYAEMPLPQPVEIRVEEWLRDEATLPDGSFAAFAAQGAPDGEPVGYAGLLERPGGQVAEHGLTVVKRDFRRRGVAVALKRAVIHWASHNGIRELVTWTQRGNEAMQALNRKLGYVDRERVLTFQGPLP